MIAIVWSIILFLLPIALSVGRTLVMRVLGEVKKVEEQTDLTGADKRDLVIRAIKYELVEAEANLPLWTLNAILECCVSYVKVTNGSK